MSDTLYMPARQHDLAGPDPEMMVLAAFLSGYREPTRSNHGLNVRKWFEWCYARRLMPMEAERAHIELYARHLEENEGKKLSTITHKLGAISRFYHFAVIDRYLPSNPAEFVRRPSVPRVSSTNGLSRSELLTILDVAQKTHPRDHALVCILGLNGIRIGELVVMNIDDLTRQGGYWTLKVQREKDGETPLIPLSPRTSFAVEQMIFGRSSGPLFLNREGNRLDKAGANRIVKRLVKEAGITKRISCHSFRHTFITLSLDAGVSVRDVQHSVGHRDVRQVSYYDRNRNSLPRNATHMVSAYVEGS